MSEKFLRHVCVARLPSLLSLSDTTFRASENASDAPIRMVAFLSEMASKNASIGRLVQQHSLPEGQTAPLPKCAQARKASGQLAK